ncbi:MAG: 6-phosphogluconolactonase, partial [Deltaproteobacteria bacterium]|nr:6-phosphogluconolactonase [Deltaproteobacteria bacterium]
NQCVMKPEIRSYSSLRELSLAAAEFIAELAEARIKERNIFTLVLSGGNTPRQLYEELASLPISKRIDWQHTHLFWGDERCVPSDNPDSNFSLAFQALISRVDVPPANIHRIPATTGSAKAVAKEYEKTLREFFQHAAENDSSTSFPSFDLVLLGLGADGHTASLFPGDAALEERTSWVVAVEGSSASPPVPRITLTFPVINEAKCVLFLVSGSNKLRVLQEILNNPHTATYPAARVKPSGRLLWFIDEWLA